MQEGGQGTAAVRGEQYRTLQIVSQILGDYKRQELSASAMQTKNSCLFALSLGLTSDTVLYRAPADIIIL
jgi:hypothetical protein